MRIEGCIEASHGVFSVQATRKITGDDRMPRILKANSPKEEQIMLGEASDDEAGADGSGSSSSSLNSSAARRQV